jgi:hypothetical protein
MDRRKRPRVAASLSVRLWGIDAHSLPFMELARVTNISGSGAVIQGMARTVRSGAVLEMQYGQEKTQVRVIWVGRAGTPCAGEVGVQQLPSEPCIWDVDLAHCQVSGRS